MGSGGSPTQYAQPNRTLDNLGAWSNNNFIQYDPNSWQRALSNSFGNYNIQPQSNQIDTAYSLMNNPNSPIYSPDNMGAMQDIYSMINSQPTQDVQNMQPIQQTPTMNRNASFDNVIPLILRNEGGYVNFKSRYGGETNHGIIKSTFDSARRRGLIKSPNVRNLTEDDARTIYRTDFWNQSKAGQLPDALAGIYFDYYIQSPKGGSITLQRAINKMAGRNIVNVDGRVGQKTIDAANSLITDNDSLRQFVDIFCNEREARHRKYNPEIIKGLINRNERNRKWANQQISNSNVQAQTKPQPQTPQLSPVNVDFSQDIPQPVNRTLYPNYVDWLNSQKHYNDLLNQWGGISY